MPRNRARQVRRLVERPFNPTEEGKLEAWFDANQGFAPSQWNDLSGNGRHVVQATGANQPAAQSTWTGGGAVGNGRQVVYFSGSPKRMASSAFSTQLAVPAVVFIVADVLNHTVEKAFMDGIAVGNRFYCSALTTAAQNRIFLGTSVLGIGSGSVADMTTPQIYEGRWGYSSNAILATNLTIFYDGVQKNTGGTATLPNLTGITLGTNYNASAVFLNGCIGEVLLYSGFLTATNIQRIRAYLNTKWGLGLSL